MHGVKNVVGKVKILSLKMRVETDEYIWELWEE